MKLKWEFCLFYCFFFFISSKNVSLSGLYFCFRACTLYTNLLRYQRQQIQCYFWCRIIQRSQLTWGSIRTEYFFILTPVLWSQHDLKFQTHFGSGTWFPTYECLLYCICMYVLRFMYDQWSYTSYNRNQCGSVNAKKKMKTHTTQNNETNGLHDQNESLSFTICNGQNAVQCLLLKRVLQSLSHAQHIRWT